MPDIRHTVATHNALRQELLERWPELIDDDEALRDSLDGISDLSDVIATMLRSKLSDDRLAKGLGEYIDDLRKRKKRYEDRAERKRALALYAMQEGQLKRIERSDLTAFIGQSPGKVIITNESALASTWLRVKTEPDKIAIGNALKAGIEIEGATLSNPEPRLSIRTS